MICAPRCARKAAASTTADTLRRRYLSVGRWTSRDPQMRFSVQTIAQHEHVEIIKNEWNAFVSRALTIKANEAVDYSVVI